MFTANFESLWEIYQQKSQEWENIVLLSGWEKYSQVNIVYVYKTGENKILFTVERRSSNH